MEEIKDPTAWLEAYDAESREIRAKRLRELLDIFPAPSGGTTFFGGDESVICFNEVKRCYLDGSYMAVVLLCLAFIEKTLAADLYTAGWKPAAKSSLGKVLEKAHEDGVLSESDLRTFRRLADLRNSRAHFQGYGNPKEKQPSLMDRTIRENTFPLEVLAKDARFAAEAMVRIVKRQAGMRVALGLPNE